MEEAACLLRQLADMVAVCQRCALGAGRTLAVPGEGPPDAAIMLVGEGPGKQEDYAGRPFVGAAGQLLGQLLTRAGLQRADIFITNLVKCRPPGNRAPRRAEIEACRPYLDGQITLLNPRIICLLGQVAVRALLGAKGMMSELHGIPQERDGIIHVPLYHPAAALYQPSLQSILVADLKHLRLLLHSK